MDIHVFNICQMSSIQNGTFLTVSSEINALEMHLSVLNYQMQIDYVNIANLVNGGVGNKPLS